MTNIIDNTTQKFIDEISSSSSKDATLYFSAQRSSIYALEGLLTSFKGRIKILLNQESLEPLTLLDEPEDFPLKTRLGFLNTCLKVLKKNDRFEIKLGNAGVNGLFIKNGATIQSFILASSSKVCPPELGIIPSIKPQNIIRQTEETGNILLSQFLSEWERSTPISSEFFTNLQQSFEYLTPHHQYLYILNRLFEDSKNLLSQDAIKRTGFFNSKIWNTLYPFQKDAVLGAIDKIERFNGCIIADSVGLGKTFEALAIMKYNQERNLTVLVLCPKRLYENWAAFQPWHKGNFLKEDRLNFDILYHTDLSRTKGMSNGINLGKLNWSNYDLIVIDESHNFRNNYPHKNKKTRYQRLMQDMIKEGVRSKVLMLSATPVNNRLNDLKNQLYFITEEDDQALSNIGISSIKEVMRKAQSVFNTWMKSGLNNRDSLLEKMEDGRYFKILDLLTIARSRRHIEKYYSDPSVGPFPNRRLPINIYSGFDTSDEFPPIGKINEELLRLNMSVYQPMKFILPDKKPDYEKKYDYQLKSGSAFRQEQREESLVKLMKTGILKRLESSVHSFQITVERMLDNIENTLDQLEHFQKHSKSMRTNLGILDEMLEEEVEMEALLGEKVKVLIQDLDIRKFRQELQLDQRIIQGILHKGKKLTSKRDAKLKKLRSLISEKVNNPINPGNKKILIFTAYADTATYLYENVAAWAREDFGLFTGMVTGGSGKNRTNLPNQPNDFNEIMLHFSPRSKNRVETESEVHSEIDILIGTDCISEGQNLQDCDYLVNYDIHWNPVRIVQRFGRIDRIGSKNQEIQLVNFWPNIDLNTYINLIDRVKGRMVILDVSATGDENLIETDQMQGELEYRANQLKQLQNQVIDLEDVQGGISITDLTFTDFKVDLDHLTPVEIEELEKIPSGQIAVAPPDGDMVIPGIIICVKDLMAHPERASGNPMYPYYLIYFNDRQSIYLSPKKAKKILDTIRKSAWNLAAGKQSLMVDGKIPSKKMDSINRYTKIFNRAMEVIQEAGEEDLLKSLSQSEGTLDVSDNRQDMLRYQLISAIVIHE